MPFTSIQLYKEVRYGFSVLNFPYIFMAGNTVLALTNYRQLLLYIYHEQRLRWTWTMVSWAHASKGYCELVITVHSTLSSPNQISSWVDPPHQMPYSWWYIYWHWNEYCGQGCSFPNCRYEHVCFHCVYNLAVLIIKPYFARIIPVNTQGHSSDQNHCSNDLCGTILYNRGHN